VAQDEYCQKQGWALDTNNRNYQSIDVLINTFYDIKESIEIFFDTLLLKFKKKNV
jgi:hypothetical protein